MAIHYQKKVALQAEQKAEGVSIVQSSRAFKLPETGFYELLSMANPKIKRSDAIAVVEALREVILNQCANGVAVRLPELFDIVPFVRGTQDAKGEWLKGPHVGLRMQVSQDLTPQLQRQAVLEPIDTRTIIPIITVVEDCQSGTINSVLTRGKMIAITGQHLKWHPLAGDEGVYFIKPDGTELKALRGLDNTPTRLSVEVPEGLPEAESCTLAVRMRMNRNKALRSSDCATVFQIV